VNIIMRNLSVSCAIAWLVCTYIAAISQEVNKSVARSPFAREMMQSMAKMDRDMMAAPMTGDADHDFASMMIPHHQGAVDMAKSELLYGTDPVLRRLSSRTQFARRNQTRCNLMDLRRNYVRVLSA
jgi:hypothetical protein